MPYLTLPLLTLRYTLPYALPDLAPFVIPYLIPHLTLPQLTLLITLPYLTGYVIPYLTLPQLTLRITLPYALCHTSYFTFDTKSGVMVLVQRMYDDRNIDTDNRTLKNT